MMKRRTVLKLMAAPALMTVARPGFAKEKVTYAYLLDPAYDAVTWAMSNGKVNSDLSDAKARGLELTVLSTGLQQAAAGEGAGVWVKSDSPIKDPKELKGKTLGSYALRST